MNLPPSNPARTNTLPRLVLPDDIYAFGLTKLSLNFTRQLGNDI
jgi:hypothetical protein